MTIITPVDSHSWPIMRCFIYTPPAGSAKRCDLLKMSSSLCVNHNKRDFLAFISWSTRFFFCVFVVTKGTRRRVCLLSSLEDIPLSAADATLMQHFCKRANASFSSFFPPHCCFCVLMHLISAAKCCGPFPRYDLLILEVPTGVLTWPQRH